MTLSLTHTGSGAGQRYLLEQRLAVGGMGEVWRATDTALEREVAVKLLKPEYAQDQTFRSRFEAEARNAGALHHKHVAAVFDYAELPDGVGPPRPCLVMELVEGQPLSALLTAEGALNPQRAVHLVAQAADGVAAAHAVGIVHRDLKPANILVTHEGQVKVTDFGIAHTADAVPLTQTGEVIGTPDYLAPEQVDGRPTTFASDVYALGVVLHECLTGNRPFRRETSVATALAHLHDPPPPLPATVPPWLAAVVSKALAKDPGERFVTADALFAALCAGESGHSEVAATPGPDDAPPPTTTLHLRASRRRRLPLPLLVVAVIAGVALLLAVALGIGNLLGGPEGTTGPQAHISDRTPTAGPESVRVRLADYVGRPVDVAQRRLRTLGLEVGTTLRANGGGHIAGNVADVRPTGLVPLGSTVVLTVWSAPPPTTTQQPGTHHPGKSKDGKGHGKGKKG